MGTIFTDEEYRILLSALSRERKICEKIDAEMPGEVSLVKLMNNIERKISRIQYQNKDTNTERKGVLILDAPECCITPEGRVRCPLAWQQQFCSIFSPHREIRLAFGHFFCHLPFNIVTHLNPSYLFSFLTPLFLYT